MNGKLKDNLEAEKQIEDTNEVIVDFTVLEIQRKKDGTFLIENNNLPFHITDDYPCGDITADVNREYIANGGEITEYIEPTLELSEEEKTKQQINELKTQLTATDYKVIRSVENGISLSDEVVVKRQSIRDDINLLEAKLESLRSII